jgi:uncharacterized integral membrane protein
MAPIIAGAAPQVSTIVIPLPPAVVGGAMIAASLLGRRLIGVRRRRPRRATTYR